jgi:hypothetical protein
LKSLNSNENNMFRHLERFTYFMKSIKSLSLRESKQNRKCNCKECGSEKKLEYCDFCEKATNSILSITVSDTVRVKESIGIVSKRAGFKRFLKKVFQGFQMSKDKERYPKGVEKNMVIDRENDWYDEVVVDLNTEETSRNVHEPLSEHVSNSRRKLRNKILSMDESDKASMV